MKRISKKIPLVALFAAAVLAVPSLARADVLASSNFTANPAPRRPAASPTIQTTP